jgi:hypothetical protein
MAFGFTGKISAAAYRLAMSKRKKTNRDRAVIEFYRFKNRKKATPFIAYKKGAKLTNWTGLRLCTVTSASTARSGWRDVSGRRPERVSVHARCIDGRRYVGSGAGDNMSFRMRPARGRR